MDVCSDIFLSFVMYSERLLIKLISWMFPNLILVFEGVQELLHFQFGNHKLKHQNNLRVYYRRDPSHY